MADSVFDPQSPLNCPICLNLLKDPVTIPCGHSFCMDCIKRCWDLDGRGGVHSCPTCREGFKQRPALSKSKVLADILEGMKPESLAGPGDVKCDVCEGMKAKAIASCLVCVASYCQTHVRPHKSEAFKIHKLVKASPNLQQQICPQHHKALEVYCYMDQKCICVVCMGHQHSGHKMVSAAAAMAKKQEELKIIQKDLMQKSNDKDKAVQQFKKNVSSSKSSARAAVEKSDQIFSEIILSVQNRQAEVRENIRAQENKEVQDAENHIKTLEKEICELQRENWKLEPLLRTQDHVHFFQNYSQPSLTFPFGILQNNSSKNVNLTAEKLEQSLSAMRSQLENVCDDHMGRILNRGVITISHVNKRKRGTNRKPGVRTMRVQLPDEGEDDDDDDDDDSTDTDYTRFP